jgi:enoyl-CoA hydratase
MSYSHIQFEVGNDGISLLRVNRPEKRNALSAAVVTELDDAISRAARESDIRALIVTGSGDKAFIAGADIAEIAALSPIELRATSMAGQRAFRRLETMGKPSVAAINGWALGGGLELAMACTVRFACDEARMGQPEVRLGLVAGYGGTQRLPRLIGRGRALEILLSGEPVTAAEAHRIGLVNAVVPQAQLLDYSRAWLAKVLENAPIAIALTMDAVDAGYHSGLDEALALESTVFGVAAATQDRAEGMAAFLARRAPKFEGK